MVELLYFDGCPHWREAAAAIDEAARTTGISTQVCATAVNNLDEAVRRRFFGSPTVRIAGRDVEPGAERRSDYALACRVYESEEGVAGTPRLK
ncbi:MAG: DF family (seleno)protein [Gaiellaceae bacterium]